MAGKMSDLLFQSCLAIAALASLACASPAWAAESADPAPVQAGCDIHIWQRGLYLSEAPSNYAAFGLLGAVLQAGHDRKYPPASIEGLMEGEFNIDALPATLRPIAWQTYTGTATNSIVFERKALSDADFKALKASNARQSASQADCNIELYFGRQTFTGGGIKSHLFSDIYARTFYGARYAAKGAILWDQTRKVSITDEPSLASARDTFRIALVNVLNKFLQNKLPKR